MERTLSKKQRLSLLLISLFLHAALLTTLFVSLTDPHAQKLFAQEKKATLLKVLQELPQKHPRWVATKARASQFGVPVVFDDEPPLQSAGANVVPQAQQVPQIIAGQKQSIQNKEQQGSSSTQAKPQPFSDDTSESNVEEKSEVSELKPVTIAQERVEKLSPVDQKKQPEKSAHMIQKAAAIAHSNNSSQSNSQTASQQPSGSGGIRKPITLAQIAKGFTENLKNKGTHSVTMRGEAKGIPTDEQLKYERYLQRLQWCIQNSMKIHQREFRVPPKTSLDIHVGIDRSGTLAELVLVRSSGDSDLDEFILFTFKDASSSFPPVPAFFKEQLFTVLFIVKCMDVEQPGFRFFMQ